MDFTKFEQNLLKYATPQQELKPTTYIFKAIYDDLSANEIDFSRFSYEDVVTVVNTFENEARFDEETELYNLHIPEMDKAIAISEREYAIGNRFMMERFSRKKRITFI